MSTQQTALSREQFTDVGEPRFEDIGECQYVGADCGRAIDPDAVGRYILRPTVCRACFGDRSLAAAKRATRSEGAKLWTNKGSSTVHFHGGDSDA